MAGNEKRNGRRNGTIETKNILEGGGKKMIKTSGGGRNAMNVMEVYGHGRPE